MIKAFIHLTNFVLACIMLSGCSDSLELAKKSFGKIGHSSSRADGASVISMGRDDDDGNATKWHIGGGID